MHDANTVTKIDEINLTYNATTLIMHISSLIISTKFTDRKKNEDDPWINHTKSLAYHNNRYLHLNVRTVRNYQRSTQDEQ